MKKLYTSLFLAITFTASNSQSFTNPGFETWSSNCPVNTAPFTWVNFSSSLGPDQAGTCAGTVVSQQGSSHMNLVWANFGLLEGAQQLLSGLTINTSYAVNFYAINDRGLYAPGNGSCFLDVYVDNVVVFSTPELFNTGNWTAYAANFTATATSAIIGFQVRGGTGTDGSVGVDNVTVAVTTGVNGSSKLDATVNVFPNPSTGIFNVSSAKEITLIEVVDVVGAKVLSQPINNLTISPINLSQQAKGVYFIRIATSEGMVTKRVILQ